MSPSRSGAGSRGIEGIRRVLSARSPGEPLVVLTADVEPAYADELLSVLNELEI